MPGDDGTAENFFQRKKRLEEELGHMNAQLTGRQYGGGVSSRIRCLLIQKVILCRDQENAEKYAWCLRMPVSVR